jgi:hypothetical protein
MGQAEQTTAGECALKRTCERGRECLAHRRPGGVGEDAVRETLELQLARPMKPTSESSAPRKAFANACSAAVAASLLSAT